MPIETIKLTNFESHENTVINLHHGVNVIAGESDEGKSGILRGLELVAKNTPAGDEFISHWVDSSSVEIRVDGHTIVRSRGKALNNYVLDGKELKGFGIKVPEPIAALFNMSDINWQDQFAGHFLISETPRNVALELNRMVNLDIIDGSLRAINTMLQRERQNLKLAENTVKVNEEKLKNYLWVGDAEEQLSSLFKLQQKVTDLEQAVFGLERSIKKCKAFESEIATCKETVQFKGTIDSLLQQIKDLNTAKSTIQELETIIQRITVTATRIAKSSKVVRFKPELEKAIKEAEQVQAMETTIRKLLLRIGSIEKLQASIETSKKLGKTLRAKLKELMPDVCPLCETELK